MTHELVPSIPETAPFTPEQRAYLNGFFAGLFSRQPADIAASAAPAPALRPLTILFGSQTGNAEGLAKKLAKELGKHGFAPTVVEMAQYNAGNLKDERQLLIITSTYGDGEPPDNARGFWEFLASDAAPRLQQLEFSVLALGDTNYEKFCQCGKDFDRRLEQLGAKRIHDRIDCDVNYDEPFQTWLAGVTTALSSVAGAGSFRDEESVPPHGLARSRPSTILSVGSDNASSSATATPASQRYSRKHPFPARLVVNRRLNAPGSAKETRHFELSLEGSGLTYEVGDALGVWPTNPPERVEHFMRAIHCNGDAEAMRDALTREYELARVNPPDRPVPAADLLATLKKLQPRLYSIASSPTAHPGQVHLCVAIVRGEQPGVCSTFLADRVAEGAPVPVFVQPNRNFRLPARGDVPIIMVGPGTGIAPFRAFLHQRRATAATGKNWLFFGDQCAATDFMYREELKTMLAEGTLTRLDTAFSRDQAGKVYVQHRMLEHVRELYAWLEDGAHVYVCGDAQRMAKDVEAALHKLIELAARQSPDQAAAYVDTLKTQKRYQRDVY
jgi:sulfite reductase (NADPH) flavoprotein alpha-component